MKILVTTGHKKSRYTLALLNNLLTIHKDASNHNGDDIKIKAILLLIDELLIIKKGRYIPK